MKWCRESNQGRVRAVPEQTLLLSKAPLAYVTPPLHHPLLTFLLNQCSDSLTISQSHKPLDKFQQGAVIEVLTTVLQPSLLLRSPSRGALSLSATCVHLSATLLTCAGQESLWL